MKKVKGMLFLLLTAMAASMAFLAWAEAEEIRTDKPPL